MKPIGLEFWHPVAKGMLCRQTVDRSDRTENQRE